MKVSKMYDNLYSQSLLECSSNLGLKVKTLHVKRRQIITNCVQQKLEKKRLSLNPLLPSQSLKVEDKVQTYFHQPNKGWLYCTHSWYIFIPSSHDVAVSVFFAFFHVKRGNLKIHHFLEIFVFSNYLKLADMKILDLVWTYPT